VRVLHRRLRAEWAQPFTGSPRWFVCNHAGRWGHRHLRKFPLADELHPWNERPGAERHARCPPTCGRITGGGRTPAGRPCSRARLPYVAAAILPPILRTTPTGPCITTIRVMRTLRESIRILKAGESTGYFSRTAFRPRLPRSSAQRRLSALAPAYARVTGKGAGLLARAYRFGAPRVPRGQTPVLRARARPGKSRAGRCLRRSAGHRKPSGEKDDVFHPYVKHKLFPPPPAHAARMVFRSVRPCARRPQVDSFPCDVVE
jgi:hypothetical protein